MFNIYKISMFAIVFFSFVFLVRAEPQCRSSETREQCELRLNAEIKAKEEEIKRLTGDIIAEDGKQKTISGEINKLKSEITETESAINKKSTLITNIRNEINKKENSLEDLNTKLRREKESLEKILRKRYELDDATLFEYLLSNKKVSDFYEDAPAFSYVQSSLSDSFNYIANLKEDIYGEKLSLEYKKEQQNNERYSLKLEKGKIEVQKKDRDQALSVSKSKKAGLAELRKLRKEEIAKIRSTLIQFKGNGISKSISFGEAYDYAKNASERTGVRTAFIMAIMQQESGFGRNVGGCYLTKKPIGLVNGSYQVDGIYVKSKNPSKKNMIPSHFDAFVRITSALGRDWKTTPISCAIRNSDGTYYGYGGAMGYTQFIPGTWELVSSRVKIYLGVQVADPWNARDAVMATGVFLQDKGAASQTYTSEYNAACRYYGSCSSYAPSVMNKAAKIQPTINHLERD